MVAMGLTINVAQQLGYEPRQGLDLYFITLAKKDKRTLLNQKVWVFRRMCWRTQ